MTSLSSSLAHLHAQLDLPHGGDLLHVGAKVPTVLLTTTVWWAFAARMAARFNKLGFRVEAVCPVGHPLYKTRGVHRLHRYSAVRPIGSLGKAIGTARPDLVVPCDDRALSHLHCLYERSDTHRRDILERSLGSPASFPIVDSRVELIRCARSAGLRAPETLEVNSAASAGVAFEALGAAAVMKVDGTWGGLGVVVVRSAAQAEAAFEKLSRPLPVVRALKRLLVDRDAFHVLPCLSRAVPRVSLQRYVEGHPANCVVSCRRGRVLGGIYVNVLKARTEVGASTVVQVTDNAEMRDMAEQLVGQLGLSGFCGLDFIVESATGRAHLIELNGRSTPLASLALGVGCDPMSALAGTMTGLAVSSEPSTVNKTIALFPQAWRQDPTMPALHEAFHDVPWDDPRLLAELVRLPWPDRGLLARMLARWRAKHVGMVDAGPKHAALSRRPLEQTASTFL